MNQGLSVQGNHTGQLLGTALNSPSSSGPWAQDCGGDVHERLAGLGVMCNINNDTKKVQGGPGTVESAFTFPNGCFAHSLDSGADPRSKSMFPSSAPPAHKAVGDRLKHEAVANALECRLMLPHGTRGHKRPRLEDRLKEVIPAY